MGKTIKLLEDWPIGEFVAGIDEVGRGCGAGPVVAAAVILPRGFTSPLIRDSKKLSEKQRNEAYKIILDNAISYSVNAGSPSSINQHGIDKATFMVMHKCLSELKPSAEHIIVDGTQWESYNTPYDVVTCIPKGDDRYTCIAAASIIAKVRRDEYMTKLHELHPEYGWDTNKGYLTEQHIKGLKANNATKYHRLMFIKNFINK